MFLLTLTLALYFAPALLAGSRHHPRAGTIALVNALAGWTIVGWLVCLVWSLSEPDRLATTMLQLSSPSGDRSDTAYPAGWSAAVVRGPESSCRICTRPVLPRAAFCSMCGATLR